MARLEFDAIVSGIVNGSEISVRGGGSIDEELGFTDGTYDISKLPHFYAPGLLTACILTGYPNATASTSELKNPFQGRSYGYERELRFKTGEVLAYRAECTVAGAALMSHFYLNGAVPVVPVPPCFFQEIEESWVTDQTGRLHGRFEAQWDGGSSGQVVASASSDYRFKLGEPVAALRRLRLDAQTRGDQFRLLQESHLT
jgi:hypothetical protein